MSDKKGWDPDAVAPPGEHALDRLHHRSTNKSVIWVIVALIFFLGVGALVQSGVFQ